MGRKPLKTGALKNLLGCRKNSASETLNALDRGSTIGTPEFDVVADAGRQKLSLCGTGEDAFVGGATTQDLNRRKTHRSGGLSDEVKSLSQYASLDRFSYRDSNGLALRG